jgi:hypothetical protein
LVKLFEGVFVLPDEDGDPLSTGCGVLSGPFQARLQELAAALHISLLCLVQAVP